MQVFFDGFRSATEASCETYPMKWVDTDKNEYPRRDNDYVSVPAKYKSRLVGCGNFETTEGLRTDSPAGDVKSAQYRLQLVRSSPRPHSLMRFHEWILSRTRN